MGFETSPNEHLRFASWILPWGACSTNIVEIEGPYSECFPFSCGGLIGQIVVLSIIGFGLVSKEILQLIM